MRYGHVKGESELGGPVAALVDGVLPGCVAAADAVVASGAADYGEHGALKVNSIFADGPEPDDAGGSPNTFVGRSRRGGL